MKDLNKYFFMFIIGCLLIALVATVFISAVVWDIFTGKL